MKSNLAPVVIIGCERVKLLKRLIISLKKNDLSKNTKAYFFIDFTNNDKAKKKIIFLLKKINFFNEKKIILRKKKFGLKKNISNAINYVFRYHDKIIVLEDDLELTKYGLLYFNRSLNKFKDNDKIYTISGFSFNNKNDSEIFKNKNLMLAKRPSSWGWATWKKKWFKLKTLNVENINYYSSSYGNDLILMGLKKNIRMLDSWAYDWTIRHIIHDKYCAYPRKSYIINNGHDKHSNNNFFKIKKKNSNLNNKVIKSYNYQIENKMIRDKFKNYYSQFFLIFIIKLVLFKILRFIKY